MYQELHLCEDYQLARREKSSTFLYHTRLKNWQKVGGRRFAGHMSGLPCSEPYMYLLITNRPLSMSAKIQAANFPPAPHSAPRISVRERKCVFKVHTYIHHARHLALECVIFAFAQATTYTGLCSLPENPIADASCAVAWPTTYTGREMIPASGISCRAVCIPLIGAYAQERSDSDGAGLIRNSSCQSQETESPHTHSHCFPQQVQT